MPSLKKYTAADCEECPLSDCYPTNPRCPVLRKELQDKGLPLPETRELMQEAPQVGRPRKIKAVPGEYEDRQDYQKKYMRNYRRVTVKERRVAVKGIKLRKGDIEILEAHFEKHGEALEEEVATLLEFWAEWIRKKRQE